MIARVTTEKELYPAIAKWEITRSKEYQEDALALMYKSWGYKYIRGSHE